MLEVVAGQEVTMQNFPQCGLGVLADEHKEMVFSVMRKKIVCPVISYLQHPGEDARRDYALSHLRSLNKISSRYDYSSSCSYKNLFLNISLLQSAIFIWPSAFPNFPGRPLNSHEAALGQQRHLLAGMKNFWTQHLFLNCLSCIF